MKKVNETFIFPAKVLIIHIRLHNDWKEFWYNDILGIFHKFVIIFKRKYHTLNVIIHSKYGKKFIYSYLKVDIGKIKNRAYSYFY